MFNTSTNLLTKSGLNVDQINALLNGHGKLQGLGQAFIDVENRDGVNAFWGMAQCIEETGWGTSAIAEDKNNLFGITAYDANPYGDASSYNSPADCVEYWGDFIKKAYLTPGGSYFVSATPAGVARHWATDPNYASQVVALMNQLAGSSDGTPAAEPVAPVAGDIYTVQRNDNMSLIAQNEGVTLGQLEAANPQAGHPAGSYGNIWPGDELVIPGKSAPAPAPAPAPSDEATYINVPAGRDGYLSVLAEEYGTTVAQLVAWNVGKYPNMTPDFVEAGWNIRVK
jgi:LysM repeat protein